jgi:Lrp/AsnC family leucine-responsive transcriptional regulator
MDPVDAKLLDLLQKDCSRSLAQLGEHVGLSVSAVNERLRKLRARGDVRAYVALINPAAYGYTTCAFIQVAMAGTTNERDFVAAVGKMREVQECHHISGEFQYLLKVWAANVQLLHELVETRIKAFTGVIRTQTLIVLASPKEQVTGLVGNDQVATG